MYSFTVICAIVYGFICSVAATPVSAQPALTQSFTSAGRWVLDGNGQRFKLRCVQWVGHLEPNIPEGLQFQSVDWISAFIAKNNFNCVRLSYSTDFALNQNVTVKDSFTSAEQKTNATGLADLYTDIQKNNPFIKDTTTVAEVFTAAITSLSKQNIKVIFNNQVSKAGWCCGQDDGNGWFKLPGVDPNSPQGKDSAYFDIPNWLNGLKAIAQYATAFPNVIGMDVRNELRPINQDTDNWYKYVPQAAQLIHSTNPILLIMIGGTSYDTTLDFLASQPLDTSAWMNRTVWELHSYPWGSSGFFTSGNPSQDSQECSKMTTQLGNSGFFLLSQNKPYTGPLWLGEFGIALSDVQDSQIKWLSCLVKYLQSNDADWNLWTLGGSYYVKGSTTNAEETYGVTDAKWTGLRNGNLSILLGGTLNSTQGPASPLTSRSRILL